MSYRARKSVAQGGRKGQAGFSEGIAICALKEPGQVVMRMRLANMSQCHDMYLGCAGIRSQYRTDKMYRLF
jgi:hypothetical protein